MDNQISLRADVVTAQTQPRPTATPVRVQFADVLSGGAQALVRGAQAAVSAIPGAPLAAVAVRGGGLGTPVTSSHLYGIGAAPSVASTLTVPEGPGGTGVATLGGMSVGLAGASAGASSDGGLENTMAQSEQMNLYYLQVQEEVNAQNRTYTALSNVLEVEHSTAKSAIGNIH
jgi:hypothetical protein